MGEKEIKGLWKRFYRKRERWIRNKLAEHYYPFVLGLSRKMVSKLNFKIPEDEIASNGVLGLYKAIDKYSPDFRTKFETYAYIRIMGTIIDNMRSEDIVPRSVRMRFSKIEKLRATMEANAGQQVPDDEVLSCLGIDLKDYNKHVHKYQPMMFSSIEICSENETENPTDNKKDFNKYLIATREPLPEDHLLNEEFLDKLMGKDFNEIEKQIIYMYYYEKKTMKEIAGSIDISEPRISQIHRGLLNRLKNRIKLNPNYFCEEIFDYHKGEQENPVVSI